MVIAQQLLVVEALRCIGFFGGKGRDHILNQLANELARSGKKIVISHIDKKILPSTGYIIYHKIEQKLHKLIESEIQQNPIIYAGSALEDYFLSGISSRMVKRLLKSKQIDYVLLVFGEEENTSLFTRREIAEILKLDYLEELLYFFQIDKIDLPLSSQLEVKPSEFFKAFPQHQKENTLNHRLIIDYLTDPNNGAFKLFQQEWPVLLLLTDVDDFFLENRAINLARDLYSEKIEYIYQANLKENMVKRIYS
jgi:hypothetical protein